MKPKHPSTHPLLPPTTEDDRVSWLRLLRSYRVGPSTFYRMLAEHGSAAAALAALPEVAAKAGVKDYEIYAETRAREELQLGAAMGAKLLCYGAADYPLDLSETNDAPPLVWALGDVSLLRRRMIGLVGARNASSLGLRMAKALSADLSERGFVITSGLARGIDAAAHQAALKGGTVAVLAGGADVIYPAENTHLHGALRDAGLILSERPFGLQPKARDFPRRNRIISGLSKALVVVEAAGRSGSLITARTALDQGREVLAVPGHPFDARSGGCNMLIRDGARLVRNGEDVVEALPPEAPEPQQVAEPPQQQPSLRETNLLHQQILNRLGPSPLAEDQLIRDLGASPQSILPLLTDLEMEGALLRQPGGLLSLNMSPGSAHAEKRQDA
ncbi:DNA-processing protein DprA [Thalassobius sp. MITS945101]|uniref:DNA-processing protein DprA n=1 Tax=Thalassobius sp. MITS945101 TaxID=3096994 RepID=UPI00399B2C3F